MSVDEWTPDLDLLNRLRAAHDHLVAAVRELQDERNLASPGSDWNQQVEEMIRRLEEDGASLTSLANWAQTGASGQH